MKAFKIALVLPALLLAAACGKKEPSTTSEVAVIDVRQIIQQSPVIASINKRLAAEIQPMQTAIQTKQNTLQQEATALSNPDLTEEDMLTLKLKLLEGKKALITEAGALRQQSELKQTEALADIYNKLDTSIATFNQTRNRQFKLILKQAYVLYANEDLNITTNIQNDFDTKYAS